MKKFYAIEESKVVNMEGLIYAIGAIFVTILLVNLLGHMNVLLNIIMIAFAVMGIISAFFTHQERVSGLHIDEDKKMVCVIKTKKENEERILVPFEKGRFIYQYESFSRTIIHPVLNIYNGDVLAGRLVVNKAGWDKEVMKEIISELKQQGIKGRITKTDQAGTDVFTYVN